MSTGHSPLNIKCEGLQQVSFLKKRYCEKPDPELGSGSHPKNINDHSKDDLLFASLSNSHIPEPRDVLPL